MTHFTKLGLFGISSCALAISTAIPANQNPLMEKLDSTRDQAYLHISSEQNKLESPADAKTAQPRFIIELTAPPVLQEKNRLNKLRPGGNDAVSPSSEYYKSKLSLAQEQINTQQKQVTSQLHKLSSSIKVVSQFSNVSNALVIEADKKHIAAIKKWPYVKDVIADEIESLKRTIEKSHQAPLNAKAITEHIHAGDTNYNNTALTSSPVSTVSHHSEYTGEGITVAIIDTGIDYTHPDLGGCFGIGCKVVAGYDFLNNDNDPMDEHGMGTHAARIIGSNGTLKGVAPNVTFHAYKVHDSNLGYNGFSSNVIAALEHSLNPDGDINTNDAVDIVLINYTSQVDTGHPLNKAVNNAVDAGTIVVARARGNKYGTLNSTFPANAEKAITVAAATEDGQIPEYSAKAMATEKFSKPEITALGDWVETTLPSQQGNWRTIVPSDRIAAAHATGEIALLKQAKPELTAKQAKQLLAAGADDLGLDPLAQGPGMLNIEKSLLTTTSLDQSALFLGTLDKSQASWSSTRPFTIFNHSDNARTYQLALNSELPSGTELTLSHNEITVPPNSFASVEVAIHIADTSSLAYVEHPSGIYHSRVEVISGDDDISLPIYFEHTRKLTVTTNTPYSVSVGITDNDKERRFVVNRNHPRTINVSSANIFANAIYHGITTHDIGWMTSMPQNLLGASSHHLSVTYHDHILLDIQQLNKRVYLASATHPDFGNQLGNLDFLSGAIKIEHPNYTSSQTSSDRENYYAIGDTDDNTKVIVRNNYKYNDPTAHGNEISHFSYEHEIDGNSPQNTPLDIDFAALTPTTVKIETAHQATHYVIYDYGFGVYQPLNNATELKLYSSALPEIGYRSIAVYNETDDKPGRSTLVSTPRFRRVDDNHIERHPHGDQQYALLPIENHTLRLEGKGLYLASGIEISDSEVTFYDFPFKDIMGNGYYQKSYYQFNCIADDGSQTQLSAGIFDFEHGFVASKPITQCDNLRFTIKYSSQLNGNTADSELSFPANDPRVIRYLNGTKLKHGDVFYAQPIVDKINSSLIFSPQYGLYINNVEIKIGNDEWKSVSFTRESAADIVVPLELPDGSHTVSARFTSADDIIYTYASLFQIGANAGKVHDADSDGMPNDQDPDDDNDGYQDSIDAFPYNPNEWLDTDSDGLGDNTDTDDDGDGYQDVEDSFPLDPLEWQDTDNDGVGNNNDDDDDNDSYEDTSDAFPLDPTEWLDTDQDNIGNNADPDDDNDGVLDANDAFPLDAGESVDTDGDGIGNNTDTDDDNDGVLDSNDAFPLNAGESVDTDGDGIGNNTDTDDDNDSIPDANDAFPLDPSESADTDNDGIGNNTDPDDDNDGVSDLNDAFPLDATESVDTDTDGIGNNADTDDDNDGVSDLNDVFPRDASESVDTDADGIGNNADTDDDNDGVADLNDAFPLDASESVDTDADGIGNNADTDDDNDGVSDRDDRFPLDSSRSSASVSTNGDNATSSSGGGSLGFFSLLGALLLTLRRVKRKS
ncbi:S8 family serine peptidase [Pseudoalteromonas sp. DL2-H2.2]|uniref:S8 family peptidase n=1 Tax=Pseudoalteromonas sp. DL2-H2.2 TaxID=2908889 RepID=UPI001F3F5785|nr:S8 family serine peptidase [Pseudoalteromonas sp. DL2-H2.2]MCF2907475.1 S8 family serine peptidase [Pseudoalteromonas sp. DL2-H2.2]